MKFLSTRIDAGISGFESPAAEYTELGLSLDELVVKHPNATFFGIASGHSMQGVGIYDGDLLVVDRSENVVSGQIIVANFNGNFVCKIIDKDNRRLLSASEEHPPIYIKEGDVFQLEGVVSTCIKSFLGRDWLACMP